MALVNKAYRYRFYPTDAQKKQLDRSFGCARFVYNYFLKLRTDSYYEKQERINYYKTGKLLTQLKKDNDYCWLQEVSSVGLQNTLRDLDKAFSNFFAGRAKYPAFKKRTANQSICYTKSAFSLKNEVLTIAKNKTPLNIRWSRQFNEVPSSITVSKDCAERYFVSFRVKEQVYSLPQINKSIGIDVGIKDICVTSDSFRSGAPKYSRKYEGKLSEAQRTLSRKKNGSKNREKARRKVAKIHAKIADSRNDFNNKLSTKLIRENQSISIENLNIKGMLKSRPVAKSISDSSWGSLFRKLKYKAEWYGRSIIVIDRWFPSSKRCHKCGYINNSLKLRDRSWKCPSCKEVLDRDINAAKNILTIGRKLEPLVSLLDK